MVEATWTITASELRSFIEPKLLQFLNSSDIDDITTPLAELGRPDLNPNIVEVLIIEGIERSVCLLFLVWLLVLCYPRMCL